MSREDKIEERIEILEETARNCPRLLDFHHLNGRIEDLEKNFARALDRIEGLNKALGELSGAIVGCNDRIDQLQNRPIPKEVDLAPIESELHQTKKEFLNLKTKYEERYLELKDLSKTIQSCPSAEEVDFAISAKTKNLKEMILSYQESVATSLCSFQKSVDKREHSFRKEIEDSIGVFIANMKEKMANLHSLVLKNESMIEKREHFFKEAERELRNSFETLERHVRANISEEDVLHLIRKEQESFEERFGSFTRQCGINTGRIKNLEKRQEKLELSGDK